MTDPEEFRKHAYHLVDWITDYYKEIEKYPVKSQVIPGEIYDALPDAPPESGESFECIFKDFETIIMKGITHWQHPGFHAYFNANTSFPSILGEILTAALGAQCMVWDTSPAAAELEEKVMSWLKSAMDLPPEWSGVIQDTASTATLCALLSARERASGFRINQDGFSEQPVMTCYCSTEAHSSVEKAARIAGFGSKQLRLIQVDENMAMLPGKLEDCIRTDLGKGLKPTCVVAAAGTTGTLAVDPLRAVGSIAKEYGLWFHVDAAYLGSVGLLPEKRTLLDGIELADSYVFNPHKWMFTNFDLSAYFVKDRDALIRTFELTPEYLKTKANKRVNNYKDWGVQLGRRFRALKLWFVIRAFGLEGIREKFREHIRLSDYTKCWLEGHGGFEIMAPVELNVICFRYNPGNMDIDRLNQVNAEILQKINATGKAYITHTKIRGMYVIRFVVGQTNVLQQHIDAFIELLAQTVNDLKKHV